MRSDVLFVVRVDPFCHQAAVEVLSEILTFAAFDVPLRVLFLDQGARFFDPNIDPEIEGMISALTFYGVTDLSLERDSFEGVFVDPHPALPNSLKVISAQEVVELMHQHRVVIGA